jgi:hypothetical protein
MRVVIKEGDNSIIKEGGLLRRKEEERKKGEEEEEGEEREGCKKYILTIKFMYSNVIVSGTRRWMLWEEHIKSINKISVKRRISRKVESRRI